MKLSDLDALIALGETIDWKMIPENWLFTLIPFPEHCFVAEADSKIIGSAVSYCHPGGHAFISKLIVHAPFRGRGTGTSLMQAVMNSYPADVSFLLDSSPDGTGLYRKLGFSDTGFPVIHKLRSFDFKLRPEDAAVHAERLDASDFAEICRLDLQVSGLDRSPVLKQYFESAQELAFKVRKKGKITGFCLGNRSGICREIAPLIADCTDTAKQLVIQSAKADGNHGIILDAPSNHPEFLAFLESRSMKPLIRLNRMGTGNYPHYTTENYFTLLGCNLG